jgi:tetratricopeptide (TPR) repeat protein
MGLWDSSEHELRRSYSLAQKTNDSLQIAAVLTNLACTAVERGSWDEAEEYGRAASKLHGALSTALDVLIPLRLNIANLAFYQGNVREAYSLYQNVYEHAISCDYTEFKTEVEACLGLAALQLRDSTAARRWIAEYDTSESTLTGMQERFKVEWLWGYCRRQNNPDEVRERLIRVADSQAAVDRVGSLKLLWLANMLLPSSKNEVEAIRRELREAGLGWFLYFSDRWRRLADGCRL